MSDSRQDPAGDPKDPVLHVRSREELNEIISRGPAVVYFWAPWCGPCHMFGPLYAEAAQRFTGEVSFVKINTEEARELAGLFHIRAIPTVVSFRQGRVLDVHIGVMNPAALVRMARHAAKKRKGLWARLFGKKTDS